MRAFTVTTLPRSSAHCHATASAARGIMRAMTQDLEAAVAAAAQLTPTDQSDLAEIVAAFIAARNSEPAPLSTDEIAAIEEALAQVARGEFATSEATEAILNRSWS